MKSEEMLNALTHAVGLGMALVGVSVLIVLAIKTHITSCIIGSILFGATMILTYLSSTLYHGAISPRSKKFFRSLDHATIYLAIAGGYSPYLLIYFNDTLGTFLFWLIWCLAIVGVLYKFLFFKCSETINILSYLALGWIGLLCLGGLIEKVPEPALWWALAGGIAYTLGVYFYYNDDRPFYHTAWHIFVIIGSACHYVAVLFYMILPNLVS
jgi:hemolysin III